MKKPKSSSTKIQRNDSLRKYAYFSGVGLQMLAIIGLFTFIGYRIDAAKSNSSVLWTALFALAGVCISIYTVIKAVIRNK